MNFAVDTVLTLDSPYEEGGSGSVCISEIDLLRILQTRPGYSKHMKSEAAKSYMIQRLADRWRIATPKKTKEGKKFVARMKRLGAQPNDVILYIHAQDLENLKALVAQGLNPSIFSKKDLYKRLDIDSRGIWDKSTFDCLAELGFALDANDFVLVDVDRLR